MNNEHIIAYWFYAFSEAVHQYGNDWTQCFQVKTQSGWVQPNSAYHLIDMAVQCPNLVRHAPRRITISGPGGEHSYPEPLREEPEYDDQIWLADPTVLEFFVPRLWVRSQKDRILLHRGRLHATRHAAIEHAKAEILASGGRL